MKNYKLLQIFVFFTIFALITSCTETIDKSNRYTFVNETIADFLKNREEQFSSIIYIYEKAQMMGTLQTYGTYTLFAPTNNAVDRYLREQDSIYWNTKDTEKPIDTGIYSPNLEDVSDSMLNVIAKTHIIAHKYELANMTSGVLETRNYNDRYLGISFESDEENYHVILNNQAKITVGDNLVENGVVHVIDKAVYQSNNTICSQLSNYPYFSIFYNAIALTGYEDQMQVYKDDSYDKGLETARGFNYETGQARYPHFRYYKWTIFAETDQVFAEAGIKNIDDLIKFAEGFYGEEDKNNFHSKNNALNKFVAYHILDRDVPYNKIVMHKMLHKDFDSEKAYMDNMDRYDYFETMQGTLMKVIKPLSSDDPQKYQNIFINNSKREIPYDIRMQKHMDVLIHEITEFKTNELYASFDPNTLNGTIHPIDRILIYNEEEMRFNILNERMRFDVATLLPELTTNGVRFCPTEEVGHTSGAAGDFVIPDGFCKNLKIHNDLTDVHYMSPYYWGCNYLGDEFIANGIYDFSYKLPPVPAGTYEIRFGYTATYKRAITQFYINNEITGIPVDLKIEADDPRVGWVLDSETTDNGAENDRGMRNRGYMKAPYCFTLYAPETGAYLINDKQSARYYKGAIRHIITKKYLGNGENWIRFKKVDSSDKAECMHDYFEIVPIGIINSDSEDRY